MEWNGKEGSGKDGKSPVGNRPPPCEGDKKSGLEGIGSERRGLEGSGEDWIASRLSVTGPPLARGIKKVDWKG